MHSSCLFSQSSSHFLTTENLSVDSVDGSMIYNCSSWRGKRSGQSQMRGFQGLSRGRQSSLLSRTSSGV